MTKALLILLILSSLNAFGQPRGTEDEVENVLNALIEKGILNKSIFNLALQISPYHFDGNYATERVFPNVPSTTILCVAPITFDRSIHSALKEIDNVYDSTYYQQQIQDYHPVKWSEQELSLISKTKFINSRISKLFYKEIGRMTFPLFSKDGKIAVLTYAAVNRSSVTKKRDTVYILKEDQTGWQIVEVIASKKAW
ncbi:hypothetical protein [Pontibacter rugosus]|uniref:Uncharacterized protein n=1 Tax=Pontibacter rugosus TaxID=1745966 RepID=A0ABW3ST00_9BACT